VLYTATGWFFKPGQTVVATTRAEWRNSKEIHYTSLSIISAQAKGQLGGGEAHTHSHIAQFHQDWPDAVSLPTNYRLVIFLWKTDHNPYPLNHAPQSPALDGRDDRE
jgi:hypothetical protein